MRILSLLWVMKMTTESMEMMIIAMRLTVIELERMKEMILMMLEIRREVEDKLCHNMR